MKQERLVVLGGGESGVGTALLGVAKGYDVFLSDKSLLAPNYRDVLEENAIAFEEGMHSEELILEASIVVKSPGIPDTVPLVRSLVAKHIPVVSEIEFASAFTKKPIIGITGSNGKTTTTMLVGHLLSKQIEAVGVGGNIGDSFAKQVVEDSASLYVLELSSFQLDGIVTFAPHVAIITNITPDHLDRYAYDFEKYVASKFRITKNQTASDYLIVDGDDEAIHKWITNHTIQAKVLPFSLEKKFSEGAYLEGDTMVVSLNNIHFTMSIKSLALQGKHNVKNAMAATMASKLLQMRNQTIKESLEDFEGVPHRLEKVLTISGVNYINDSKATNVNATYYALDSMTSPTVWIVGGVDKGNDYFELMALVRENVKSIVCLGIDNAKIIEAFKGVVDVIVETKGAEEAAKVAYKLSEKGDTVLLSPACASFDLFDNYQDRGDKFKAAVRAL